MNWKDVTLMEQRLEFVMLAMHTENFSELCTRFGISRKTGYKFLKRYLQEGEAGLHNRSRRPKRSPKVTAPEIEQLILELREAHPATMGSSITAGCLTLRWAVHTLLLSA